METFTRREKGIYALGLLGYDIDDFEIVDQLLEQNTLENIKIFYFRLELHNIDHKTCTHISLAGNYPKVKLKDGNFNQIFDLVEECSIEIAIE